MANNSVRAKVLEAARTRKMARSAHAYVRGNTVKFYEWLHAIHPASMPSGPPVWICGDCHVGNLGPLADANGRIDVQIRDLDQATIGNPAHDLIRLGLSLATAALGSNLPGVTTARMLEEMVQGYTHAFRATGKDKLLVEPSVVKSARRAALGRRWRHLARERIGNTKPSIPLGRRFWALASKERLAIDALMQEKSIRELVLRLNGRAQDDDLEVVDAAYWMKGCSSLGKLRYAVLIKLKDKGSEGRLALLDLKEATVSAAPPSKNAVIPSHHGARVVAGALALSPNMGERMASGDLLQRPVVVRELMPQDLKLEIEQFTKKEAAIAARYLAYVVGLAHARQLQSGERRAWAKELAKQHSKGLEAPSWLWSSVVSLAGRHGENYLEHCRRYVAAQYPSSRAKST